MGEYVKTKSVDVLISVGDNGKAIAEGAAEEPLNSAGNENGVKDTNSKEAANDPRSVATSDDKTGVRDANAAEISESLEILSFATREEATEALKAMLHKGDVVYVKASRSMELEKLVQAITE